jgi:hypothetical protein
MASSQYYNRYNGFVVDGEQTIVPYVTIPAKSSDKLYVYKVGVSRLDKISQLYYNTPYFGWLILLANPTFGGVEWNILDGSLLTIPFPLITSLQDYKGALNNYFFYYGR